jgi:membrane-associated HD superfamily phosphohydrolase
MVQHSVQYYTGLINGFKTTYGGLPLDASNIEVDTSLTEETMELEFKTISSGLQTDIKTIIDEIYGTNENIIEMDDTLYITQAELDNSTDTVMGAYGLYRDSRRQYDLNRQINALLFFAILFLFSFVNIKISYTLFAIMSLYLSVTTLSLAIDMSSIFTTILLIVFLYGVYYIRTNILINLGNPFKNVK